jgi:hypothetical protein
MSRRFEETCRLHLLTNSVTVAMEAVRSLGTPTHFEPINGEEPQNKATMRTIRSVREGQKRGSNASSERNATPQRGRQHIKHKLYLIEMILVF